MATGGGFGVSGPMVNPQTQGTRMKKRNAMTVYRVQRLKYPDLGNVMQGVWCHSIARRLPTIRHGIDVPMRYAHDM